MKKVSAIVPMYNEELYAANTIAGLKEINIITEIIAIDDGSYDNTWNIISNISEIKAIRHRKNLGKAQSIIDGINVCDADIYVFIDGDLDKTVTSIEPVINEVLNDKYDMCVAMPVQSHGGGIGMLRLFSRIVVKLITNIDFPCPISGQRAVKKEVIKNYNIKFYNRYGIEVGMLIGALKCGYKVGVIDTNFTHRYTGNDIKGYIHRFRQFNDIFIVFIREFMRW